MSTFIGKYEAKADNKGRVFIPASYRKLLAEGERDRVVMRRDAHNECLMMYPLSAWNAKVEALKSNLDEWNPDDELLLMQFVSEAEFLDIDTQGRVLISKKHMQSIAIDSNEMLFVGMSDRFAVWAKSTFESNKMHTADFAAKLKNRMMRKND